MADSLLALDAPETGLRLYVCTATAVAREAAVRHALAPGSAAALAQGLTSALLLAGHEQARVDVHLECNGPLRGMLIDADETGAVRGLTRANTVAGAPRETAARRFDARPVLASAHDERAGSLSVVRAPPEGVTAHRAAFPFAGADLAAALTLYLRGAREQGGEMAVEALVSSREPVEAAAGVLVTVVDAAESEKGRALGRPLRQGALLAAMQRADGAMAIAEALARAFRFGPLRPAGSVEPRFACRCSRERVVRALRSLGAPELGDMAARDGGANLTCDFCNAAYSFSAAELLQMAQS